MLSGMPASDDPRLRRLLDDYLRMYAGRDDQLTDSFSEDFSGFTGGGDFLVKDRAAWVAITRQDFAQVQAPIRLELLDVAIQALADTVAVATAFFKIHLPIADHFLSRRVARLVLIFRDEPAGWKIAHSSISLPEPSVRAGEVYPMTELVDRNQLLEALVAERTAQLSTANEQLRHAVAEVHTLRGILPICMHCKRIRDDVGAWQQVEQYVSANTDATFSHGLCPACMRTHYPDLVDDGS